MDKVKEQLQKNTSLLDPIGAKIKFIDDLAKKMDVNPGAPVFFFGMIATFFTVYMYGTLILITTLTILYPSLKSIRAIQTPEGDDDKTWLTYWMVFGSFTALETYVGFLLQLIPYWHAIRFLFFIWLLFPYFNGAHVMYTSVMRPMLKANQEKI